MPAANIIEIILGEFHIMQIEFADRGIEFLIAEEYCPAEGNIREGCCQRNSLIFGQRLTVQVNEFQLRQQSDRLNPPMRHQKKNSDARHERSFR